MFIVRKNAVYGDWEIIKKSLETLEGEFIQSRESELEALRKCNQLNKEELKKND